MYSFSPNMSSSEVDQVAKDEVNGCCRNITDMANWPAIGSLILPNVGGMATGCYFAGQCCKRDGTKTWFDNLNKPTWAPSKCIVKPTWAVLNTSIGYASYLVYSECDGFTEDALLPLSLYGGHLLLNWSWAPIFFRLKDFKLAFITISVATGAAAATAISFYKVDRKAGLLMLPYLAWLGYSAALNHYIWKNNPDKVKEITDDKNN